MSLSNEAKKSWWSPMVEGIKADFHLRRMLMPLRKADLSTRIKSEDKLGIKSKIFVSTFLIFNASLATLYVSFRSKQAMRSLAIPTAFSCFALLAYKLELEWVSR